MNNIPQVAPAHQTLCPPKEKNRKKWMQPAKWKRWCDYANKGHFLFVLPTQRIEGGHRGGSLLYTTRLSLFYSNFRGKWWSKTNLQKKNGSKNLFFFLSLSESLFNNAWRFIIPRLNLPKTNMIKRGRRRRFCEFVNDEKIRTNGE
jgi:hypothetical protein